MLTRPGSVRGEDLPYILGLPLIGGGPFFPHNYSHGDVVVSRTLIQYISNFARKGDPNGAVPNASASEAKYPPQNKGHEDMTGNPPYWDTYDTINQLYLELGNRPEMKNHYRGHKMSLWLNLIPQLHRPGDGDDVSMRHHHFQEEDDQYYDGFVRPQTKDRPPYIHVMLPTTTTTVRVPLATTLPPSPPPPKSDTALQATTTECPPNTTIIIPTLSKNSNNLLRKLASSHYQSYTTALTVTIAVGCFLLLLNIVIFAGIYHQRDRGKSEQKKKDEMAEAGSCSSSSGENYEKAFESRQMAYEIARPTYEYGCDKARQMAEFQMTELPLQEFKSSPPPAKRPTNDHQYQLHPYQQQEQLQQQPDVTTMASSNSQDNASQVTSPSIPEPPPPPRGQPPSNQVGILRPHGAPTTPGTMKKRVQIQEISV